ncbi:MAG TPA: hypothetical protein VF704_07355 [Allosphingosinicella sp.]
MRLLAWAVRWLGAAAALTAATAALAQQRAEGLYVANEREMASALELRADGRFRWGFSYGALDMLAEGRWRQAEDGAIVLDTEPPVRPPEVALVGSGREEAPGLAVRVADAAGHTPPYLDIEGEYDSGEPGYAHLEDDAYRFEPAPGRRIVAIRVIVGFAMFRSAPIPVPPDATLIRLSFAANDLGRADFRGARAVPDGDALVLDVLGSPIRYRRLAAEEQAEYDRMIADIAAQGAAPQPQIGSFVPVAVAGPLQLTIGGPVDPRLLPSRHGDGQFAAVGPVDLSVRVGGAQVDFGRIGGDDGVSLLVRAPGPGGRVERLDFGYQERLLTLAEALDRARALQGRLVAAGFTPHAPRAGHLEWPPFFVVAHARDGGEAFLSGREGLFGTDWESARRVLADPAIGAVTMHLFTFDMGDVQILAFTDHVPRQAERSGVPLESPIVDGREWGLSVTINRDPDVLEQRRQAGED